MCVFLSVILSGNFAFTVCLGALFVRFFFLFVSMCVYVSLCDFVCLVLLLPFLLEFSLFFFL